MLHGSVQAMEKPELTPLVQASMEAAREGSKLPAAALLQPPQVHLLTRVGAAIAEEPCLAKLAELKAALKAV